MLYVLFIKNGTSGKGKTSSNSTQSPSLIMELNLVDFVISWKCLTYNLGMFHI